MKLLRSDNRLLRWAYWLEGPPAETSGCQVAVRLLGLIPQGLFIALMSPLFAVVYAAEWIGKKRAARSTPEKHRRNPPRAARLCPWKIRVVDVRNASKCENSFCACHEAPKHVPGLGWHENFHCPRCGVAKEYDAGRGLQQPCRSCERLE